MKCDKVKELIGEAGEMPPGAAEHIAQCGSCREELAFWSAAREALRRDPDIQTPPFLHTRIMATVRAEKARAQQKSLFQRLFKPEWLTPTLASLLVALGGGYGFTQALFSPMPDDCVVRWSDQTGARIELAQLEPPAAKLSERASSMAPSISSENELAFSDADAISEGALGSSTSAPAPPPAPTGGIAPPASPAPPQPEPLQIASYAPEPKDSFAKADKQNAEERDLKDSPEGARPTELAMAKPAREEAGWMAEKAQPPKKEAALPGGLELRAPAPQTMSDERKGSDSGLLGKAGAASKGKSVATTAEAEILCLASRMGGDYSFRVKLPAASAPAQGTAWHMVVAENGQIAITDDKGQKLPAAAASFKSASSSLGLPPGTYTLSRIGS